MSLFASILFPVDFSPRCEAMIPLVAATANKFGSKLDLLHVLDLPKPGTDPAFADLVEEYGVKLRGFGTTEFRGLRVHHALRTGRPGAEIASYIEDEEIDLVMIPTHGFTRFRQLLLGSVTASVLHDAECAVWTTAHSQDQGGMPGEIRSIVCAIDMGLRTVSLLKKAKEVARAYGAKLSVVHSVPAIDPRFPSEVAAHAHHFLVESAQRAYPEKAAEAGVDAPLDVLEGQGLAESVAESLKGSGADLLLIGRGTVQGVLGRLRTNCHNLIRLAPCPVLSV